MEWLNYHHLLYFHLAAREGSVAAAARRLGLRHSTVAMQIRQLEAALGELLLERGGPRLRLTARGQVAMGYAEDIFALGRELLDVMAGRPGGPPLQLAAGIADVVPKLLARRLLRAALDLPGPVRLVCREDRPERLLADLSLHHLDLVITDAPVPPGSPVRAFGHPLLECDVTVVGTAALARRHPGSFPGRLRGAPFLLPAREAAVRRPLDAWLEAETIRPRVVAEVEDSALLKALGEDGTGFFAVATVIADDVCRRYGVRKVGRIPAVRERYFVLSLERRVRHPGVAALLEAARRMAADGAGER